MLDLHEIYDIRAAKERKRRANGPFMKPIFHESPELTSTTAPAASQVPQSPAVPSHSSTSIRAQPTIPSISSSHHGTGFISSHHTSPALAHRGTSPSKPTSSHSSWKHFAAHYNSSEVNFIAEQGAESISFHGQNRSIKALSI